MTTSIPVEVKCGKCLSPLSFPDNATETMRIFCPHCGEDCGTYGEIEKDAGNAVAAKIGRIFSGEDGP